MMVSPQSLSTGQCPGVEVFPRGRVPPIRFHGSPGCFRPLLHWRRGQTEPPGSMELRPRGFNQGESPGRSGLGLELGIPCHRLLLCPSTQTGRAELCWGPALTRAWMLDVPMMTITESIALARSSCHPADRQMCRRWPSCCRNSWRPSTRRSSESGSKVSLRPAQPS